MKTKASITFGLVDVTAKEDSTITVNDKQNFVDIMDLKKDNIEEIKYGTCEKNQFALNGTFQLMPDYEQLENMCWWSNKMSNEKGEFDTPLVMEINFTEAHSSLGITLIFSSANDYCSKLNLKYYDINDNLLSDSDYYPTNYYTICNNICENYHKIVITFYSTNNPYRYLKLYKILYGAEKVFEGDSLMSAKLLEETSLISDELTINTLDFTLFSENDEFNIVNPQGFYRLLQQRQRLNVKETLLKENKEKDMGVYYLNSWKNKEDKIMEMSATDIIGVLDKTSFNGGMYKKIKFKDLIKEILESARLYNDEYSIEDSLKNIELTGYIPICSHREALQQAVFAVGAIVNSTRGSVIKMYPLNTEAEIVNTMDKTNVWQNTKKFTQMDIVTGVEVTAHEYVADTEETKLYEANLKAGNSKVVFNEPVASMTCEGGTVIESNCNYAIIYCSKDSNVVISGYKYKDNMQTYLVEIKNLDPTLKQNTLKVESGYLIDRNNAEEVGARILAYYEKTYKTEYTNVLKNEELSNCVDVEGYAGQKLKGVITKQDIDLTGGFISDTEIIAKIKEGEDG
ncbi:MAG: hypothetical protein HFJ36_05530 [Clostridia bacterium]|nr:hypothetical protein [Clostridia bacterium]